MGLFSKYNIDAETGITTALSTDMAEKVKLWDLMIAGHAPWNDEARPSGILDAISGALADPVSEELEVSAPNNEVLDGVIKQLNEHSTELVQNLALCGGSVIRPIFANGKLQFEIIRMSNYIPTAYDFDGTLTGCVICKTFDDKNTHYLLLEIHEYKNRNHKITNKLYQILGDSGSMIPKLLTACPQTAELHESDEWKDVDYPMIIEVRNRKPNKIDGSNVPVALFGGNENLIEDADRQYWRLNWEQESGERKVFADEDLFRTRQITKDGVKKTTITGKLKRIFFNIQGNGLGEEKITTFSPEYRTTAMVEAYTQILRRIELCCNIGKGTLSDLAEVQQTATQYTGGKKALYTAIDAIESELENKYRQAAYVFAYIAAAYNLAPFNDEIEITYNDSARKDPQQMKSELLLELQNKIISPWEYRMKVYGEDEETAKAMTPEDNTPQSDPFGFAGGVNE